MCEHVYNRKPEEEPHNHSQPISLRQSEFMEWGPRRVLSKLVVSNPPVSSPSVLAVFRPGVTGIQTCS